MDHRQLLRFLTAGSVDDGKSTLIGRLLHDAHAVYRDQFEAVQAASAERSVPVDFSLLTDGLRAEREQGITIDVAYRYFGTRRRKFIVADCPGHEQYTRNLATGASTAELAVLLIDARNGVTRQTHRHAVIAWFMGIRNFAMAVNKMDLVGFREDVFRRICADFGAFLSRLGSGSIHFFPCCAPDGDNVVYPSQRTPWYDGPPLLDYLETTPISAGGTSGPLRLPVQYVIRAGDGRRFYAGPVASGAVRVGDTVGIVSSGAAVRIASLRIGNDERESARPPQSVAVELTDDVDLGRGDMLVDSEHRPVSARRFSATIVWMSANPLVLGRPYLVKHTTRYVCGSVVALSGVIDPVTLDRKPAESLSLNEFAEVEIETHHPLHADAYSENRVTGSFVVVEPISNETVAAGMIDREVVETRGNGRQNVASAATPGMAVWFTGLSSAGKSSISKAVYEKLWAKGHRVELLDGDIVRQHLSKDLGFSKEDRDENIRRIGFIAELLTRNGVIAIVAAISPYRAIRDEIRGRIGNFVEVYVNAPLAILEQRDVKGLYRKARAGEIRGVTGVDDPYQPPLSPEVECRTDLETLAQSTQKVVGAIEDRLHGPK